jgi:hypothetical protein
MSSILKLIDYISTPVFYIASPYSHPDEKIQDMRAEQAMLYTGYLLKKGIFAYSPIAHCHEISKLCELPKSFDFWKKYNAVMLAKCSHFRVLCLPDWEKSIGVQAEVKLALEGAKPIQLVDPLNYKSAAMIIPPLPKLNKQHVKRLGKLRAKDADH